MGMKIVVAPDSFKGVLSAAEAASAISAGLKDALPDVGCIEVPVADGGEGTAAALASACGAVRVVADSLSPLGMPMESEFFSNPADRTAFIDLAAASGLPLVAPEKRNPLHTSTFGTGILIRAAINRGARRIVVGVGGSATVDAGIGALQALGAKFLDETGSFVDSPACGADVERIRDVDASGLKELLSGVEVKLAADVTAPFTGHMGAARVFAPQKGADAEATERLEKALVHFKELLLKLGFIDVFSLPGSGAAGGFAGGMASVAGAEIVSGSDLVIESVRLAEALQTADFLITGEGKSDRQTLMNKAPFAAMRAAHRSGDLKPQDGTSPFYRSKKQDEAMQGNVPVILMSGVIEDREELVAAGFAETICINDGCSSAENPLDSAVAARRLRLAARTFLMTKC